MGDTAIWDYHQDVNRKHLFQGYPRQRNILKVVQKYFKKGSKIMDIGFGDGYLMHLMQKIGYNVYGQDLSQKNIDLTKKQWSNAKHIQLLLGDDSGKIHLTDNALDGLIASEVLEHMSDQEIKDFLPEVSRVVKKNGHIIFTFPAYEEMSNNSCICPNCETVFHKWGHKQHWEHDKVKTIFGKYFDIVSIKELYFPHNTKSIFLKPFAGAIWLLRSLLFNLFNKKMSMTTFRIILKNDK